MDLPFVPLLLPPRNFCWSVKLYSSPLPHHNFQHLPTHGPCSMLTLTYMYWNVFVWWTCQQHNYYRHNNNIIHSHTYKATYILHTYTQSYIGTGDLLVVLIIWGSLRLTPNNKINSHIKLCYYFATQMYKIPLLRILSYFWMNHGIVVH